MKILYLMELSSYLCTLSITLPVNALSLQHLHHPGPRFSTSSQVLLGKLMNEGPLNYQLITKSL